jgi:hypothetical protein
MEERVVEMIFSLNHSPREIEVHDDNDRKRFLRRQLSDIHGSGIDVPEDLIDLCLKAASLGTICGLSIEKIDQFAPAFRGYEPLLLSYATTAPQLQMKKWSGWQELNRRGHVPKTCG